MTMEKLLVAIPVYDSIRPEFVQSLLALEQRLQRDGIRYEVKIIAGTLVYMARDNLAKHAVNNGFSHVLWLDCDMVFGDGILDDLMTCGKDVVCGRFISRHSPYLSTLFSSLDPVMRQDDFPDDPFRIAGCGFACVLTSVQALRDVLFSTHGQCFVPTPRLSEDLAFCERVRKLGYEIWCEPTARVGHVGTLTIWPEDGEKLRKDILGIEGMVI